MLHKFVCMCACIRLHEFAFCFVIMFRSDMRLWLYSFRVAACVRLLVHYCLVLQEYYGRIQVF